MTTIYSSGYAPQYQYTPTGIKKGGCRKMTGALQKQHTLEQNIGTVAPTQSSSLETVMAILPDLAPWLKHQDVSEVMINGDGSIFVESKGRIEKIDVQISSYLLEEAAINIARQYGEDITGHRPLLDARLQDGSRVAIVYPPCSVGGPTISIRKFDKYLFLLGQLELSGSLTSEQIKVLLDAVKLRQNILIAGSTSTGKTTLVNALGPQIPSDQRVAVIEDTSELQLNLPNLIRFEARKETRDNEGRSVPAVTIRQLVVAVLRQRPDRIILGEVRGPEAFDLLRALNTGHAGSFSTIHANGPQEALDWLSALALMAMPEMSYEIVQKQVASAFQIVVHLERNEGKRRVRSISRIKKFERGEFVLEGLA